MRLQVLIFGILFSIPAYLFSQELDCDVILNTSQLTTEAKENVNNMAEQVKEYMNNYRWTKEDFGNDKIKCSITIAIQGMTAPNHFVAKAFIGSQRPIYKADQSTVVVRILDDSWEFDYNRTQSMTHLDSHFDPFLSFLDFYGYVILGYDANSYKDTYTNGKAAEYFQKAKDIANRAVGSGQTGGGWDISAQSTYTRGELIEELVNPQFLIVREAMYRYHYFGLDLFQRDSVKARKNIFSALESIAKFRKKINQPVLIAKTFFETKYLEINGKFTGSDDPEIFDKLMLIDPAHSQTYLEAKQKQPKSGN